MGSIEARLKSGLLKIYYALRALKVYYELHSHTLKIFLKNLQNLGSKLCVVKL